MLGLIVLLSIASLSCQEIVNVSDCTIVPDGKNERNDLEIITPAKPSALSDRTYVGVCAGIVSAQGAASSTINRGSENAVTDKGVLSPTGIQNILENIKGNHALLFYGLGGIPSYFSIKGQKLGLFVFDGAGVCQKEHLGDAKLQKVSVTPGSTVFLATGNLRGVVVKHGPGFMQEKPLKKIVGGSNYAEEFVDYIATKKVDFTRLREILVIFATAQK